MANTLRRLPHQVATVVWWVQVQQREVGTCSCVEQRAGATAQKAARRRQNRSRQLIWRRGPVRCRSIRRLHMAAASHQPNCADSLTLLSTAESNGAVPLDSFEEDTLPSRQYSDFVEDAETAAAAVRSADNIVRMYASMRFRLLCALLTPQRADTAARLSRGQFVSHAVGANGSALRLLLNPSALRLAQPSATLSHNNQLIGSAPYLTMSLSRRASSWTPWSRCTACTRSPTTACPGSASGSTRRRAPGSWSRSGRATTGGCSPTPTASSTTRRCGPRGVCSLARTDVTGGSVAASWSGRRCSVEEASVEVKRCFLDWTPVLDSKVIVSATASADLALRGRLPCGRRSAS